MKITIVQRIAVALACVGMFLPSSVSASAPVVSPAVTKAKVGDVALRSGGMLVGQVVDAQAKPLADAGVSIRIAGREVVKTTTDKNGVFAAKGLRSGQYEIVAVDGVVAYRLWAEKTAPPTASTAALVVAGGRVVNGQYAAVPGAVAGPGPVLQFVTNYPFVAAGIVTGAIAGGIAAADDDDPSS